MAVAALYTGLDKIGIIRNTMSFAESIEGVRAAVNRNVESSDFRSRSSNEDFDCDISHVVCEGTETISTFAARRVAEQILEYPDQGPGHSRKWATAFQALDLREDTLLTSYVGIAARF